MKKIIIALFFISSFSSFASLSTKRVQEAWNYIMNANVPLGNIDFNEKSVDIHNCQQFNTQCSGVFYIKNVGTFEIHVNKDNGSLFITDYTPRQIVRPGGLIESAD